MLAGSLLIFVACVFICLAIAIKLRAGKSVPEGFKAWKKTEAIIVHKAVTEIDSTANLYDISLKYRYTYENQEHFSSGISLEDYELDSFSKIGYRPYVITYLNQISVGDKVEILFNPQQPEEALLFKPLGLNINE